MSGKHSPNDTVSHTSKAWNVNNTAVRTAVLITNYWRAKPSNFHVLWNLQLSARNLCLLLNIVLMCWTKTFPDIYLNLNVLSMLCNSFSSFFPHGYTTTFSSVSCPSHITHVDLITTTPHTSHNKTRNDFANFKLHCVEHATAEVVKLIMIIISTLNPIIS